MPYTVQAVGGTRSEVRSLTPAATVGKPRKVLNMELARDGDMGCDTQGWCPPAFRSQDLSSVRGLSLVCTEPWEDESVQVCVCCREREGARQVSQSRASLPGLL